MEFSGKLKKKLQGWVDTIRRDIELLRQEREAETAWQKVKRFARNMGRLLFHLRKIVMAAPVVYYAMRLAAYNAVNLPETVGLNLQANGTFAETISRASAVNGPLMLTGGCLVLMFLSRKTVYPWVISMFTLIVPIVLLITNLYPC